MIRDTAVSAHIAGKYKPPPYSEGQTKGKLPPKSQPVVVKRSKTGNNKGKKYIPHRKHGQLFHYYPESGEDIRIPKKFVKKIPGAPADPRGTTESWEMPRTADYYKNVGDLESGKAKSLAAAEAQLAEIEQGYGFADTSNPFSKKKQLDEQYSIRGGRERNDYANTGSLFSGSYQRANQYREEDKAKDVDALTREYEAQKQAAAQQKRDTLENYEKSKTELEQSSTANAQNDEIDPDSVQPNTNRFASDPTGLGKKGSIKRGVIKQGSNRPYEFKTIVKDNKVYHRYPDGRTVYVRPALGKNAGKYDKRV